MGKRKTLDAQKKHLTKQEIIQKQQEEKFLNTDKDQLENPPDWLLNDIAKQEWIRLLNEFKKGSVICNLDYNNLGAYCNSIAKYQDLVKKIGNCYIVGREKNPLIELELKYSDEVRKYGNLLGLTIDSRLKSTGIQHKKEEEVIKDDFGDI